MKKLLASVARRPRAGARARTTCASVKACGRHQRVDARAQVADELDRAPRARRARQKGERAEDIHDGPRPLEGLGVTAHHEGHRRRAPSTPVLEGLAAADGGVEVGEVAASAAAALMTGAAGPRRDRAGASTTTAPGRAPSGSHQGPVSAACTAAGLGSETTTTSQPVARWRALVADTAPCSAARAHRRRRGHRPTGRARAMPAKIGPRARGQEADGGSIAHVRSMLQRATVPSAAPSRSARSASGAMMFGAWGNTDHDESIRDHPPRARRGDQLHRHRRRLRARRVRGDRRQGAGRRPARRRRPRHQGPRHDGRRPQPARQLAPLDRRARSRTACAACGTDWIDLYQIHRPEPDTDIDETLGALTDLVRAGQGALHRQLDLPAQRRSSRRSGSPSGAGASASSPSSRPTRSSCAASRPTCCPTCRRYGMGVIPWSPLAGGWLTGRYRKGAGPADDAPRASGSRSATTSRCPGNQAQARGRRRARAAGRRGRPDAHPPGARLRAPAPRRHRADHRPADDGAARVPARRRRRHARRDVLDRIDEIVPPGDEPQRYDAGWQNPALSRGARRRSA